MSASAVRLLYCGDLESGPRRLRDAGHEIVVVDPGVSPGALAAIAVQEDVDLIAVADPDLGAEALGSLDAAVVVFCITSEPGPS
jgi:hypothetical protein